MNFKTLAAAGAFALSAVAANASPVTVLLDFEGIGDLNPVGNFYSSIGVEFSPATLAVVDADAGGSGNIANEPSPSTTMFFLDANEAILTYAAGFTTGFSFFYSSSVDAVVTVWDDLMGTGNLLGSIMITNNLGGPGDPTGSFATWTAAGVSFTGVAKSINFGGTANQTTYDNITFGSDRPIVAPVPVPATLPLLAGGLALAGFIARRRRA